MATISEDFLYELEYCSDARTVSPPDKDHMGAYYMIYLAWYDVYDDKEQVILSSPDNLPYKDRMDIHLAIRNGKEIWINEAYEMPQDEGFRNNEVDKLYALQILSKKYPKLNKYVENECREFEFEFFNECNTKRI